MALTNQAKVVKKTELSRLLHHVERSVIPDDCVSAFAVPPSSSSTTI